MSNTSDKKLVEKLIRDLDTGELIELWENLTNEFNAPSVIWDMDFFLEEYLPECLNAKTIDVVDLTRIVTGSDSLVKHFDANDEFVYVNCSGLWESVNKCDIADLIIDFIRGYNLTEYSEIIKDKLSELKEDIDQE